MDAGLSNGNGSVGGGRGMEAGGAQGGASARRDAGVPASGIGLGHSASNGSMSNGPSVGVPSPALFRRRVGTYERQRKERDLILRYLRAATLSQRDGAVPRAVGPHHYPPEIAGTTESGSSARDPPTNVEGVTAAELLAGMRERPWEGEAETGTALEWREWVEHLEPILERHLVWLTVDGLAARVCRANGDAGARFVAVAPVGGERGVLGAGGQASSVGHDGLPVGGSVAAGRAGGGGSCVLAGGMRIMKSLPLKMVKPWR